MNHVTATAQIGAGQILDKPAKTSCTTTSHSMPTHSQQQLKNMHQPLDREFSKILPTSRMFLITDEDAQKTA